MAMKKLIILLAAVACLFAGCTENKQTGTRGNVDINVQSVVFVAEGEYTSVKDYLDALAADGELVYGGKEGDYGFYIEYIYNTKAEGNSFWALYTDLVTIDGDDTVYSSAEFGTFAYGGKTLFSASYGVSGLPCISGHTYALVYTVLQ